LLKRPQAGFAQLGKSVGLLRGEVVAVAHNVAHGVLVQALE